MDVPLIQGVHLGGRAGGDDVRVQLVRRRRPFAAVSEGRFGAIDDMIRHLLATIRVSGEVNLKRDGTSSWLEVLIDRVSDEEIDQESPLLALLEETASYRFVLVEGRFTEAAGLRLVDGGTAAVVDLAAFTVRDERGRARLALGWTTEQTK